ncbi:MAG: hypothetical protein ATN35_11650 [Epulopiscium sp. Nele67-Bin004]|nr:MAG: hypothetical protein ATN35_11650 [Epulopiscium sp. Nele67-Bin004]
MDVVQLQGILGLAIIVIMGIVIPISMWFSMVKKEDERREMILEKTCFSTLGIYTATLGINVIGSFVSPETFIHASTNISQLATIGILFSLNLFITKRRFGC